MIVASLKEIIIIINASSLISLINMPYGSVPWHQNFYSACLEELLQENKLEGGPMGRLEFP